MTLRLDGLGPATRVLLVEDSQDHAQLTRRELGRAHGLAFEVTHVTSLREALTVSRGSFDVILLDLGLPDGSGLSVMARLMRELEGVPIVVLTADTDGATALAALRAGAQDYLFKDAAHGDALGRALLYAVERRRVQEVLARREQQLADAQTIAHLGSWERDVPSGATTWSAELYRIFGVDRATFPASFELFLARIVHPEDRPRVTRIWEESRTTHRAPAHEHRILRPSGEVRTVFSRSSFFHAPGGAPVRVAGTYLDITDRKQMEAQIIVAGRLAAVGTLAAGVAHEINSPLAGVLGNLDFIADTIARSPVGSDPNLRGALEDARQGALQVGRIVRDLKGFVRVDGESRSRVRLPEIVEAALAVASSQVRHRAQVTRAFGETPEVEAVPGALTQVFVHLIVNAAQALEHPQVTRHEITLASHTGEGGVAVVEVRDTGVGIRAADREHIFDPFFTTRPSGTATGLGLTSAHAIVSALGGTLTVTSEPGQGSTFKVTLPPSRRPGAVLAPPRERITPGARARILVVDDEPLVGKTIARLLARRYEVTVETDARVALDRLLAGELFDLVLCDLMMPWMSGVQFHAKLEERLPLVLERLVFMSGGLAPAAQSSLPPLVNPFIEKPFQPAQLLALVQRLVDGP